MKLLTLVFAHRHGTELGNWLIAQRWLYPLIAVGILFLCILLPLTLAPMNLGVLVALIYGVGGLLLLIYRPQLGIIGVVVIAVIVPSPHLPGGLNFAVLLLILVIGLWLLNLVAHQGKLPLSDAPPIRPLLYLCLVALLAFVNGQLPWFSSVQQAPMAAQIGGLAIFFLAAGAFLVVVHLIHDLRWLEWLTWVFLALGAFFIAGWFVPPITMLTTRLIPFSTTANSMFWVWLVAMAFSQVAFNQKLATGWRVALAIFLATLLYVAFVRAYSWKGGWMPSLITIAAIIAVWSWRVGIVMAVVGTMPALYLFSQAVATDQYSYSTRLDAWGLMLEMIKVNPILGFGPANYYWYTPLFPIRGYEVQFNSHSQYLDIVAQTGILGLLCFLWFAWEIGWLGWTLRERVPEGFPRAYVYGVLGGWVGTLGAGILVDWFLPFVYNIGLSGFRASVLPWLFLGGLVSIERIYRPTA